MLLEEKRGWTGLLVSEMHRNGNLLSILKKGQLWVFPDSNYSQAPLINGLILFPQTFLLYSVFIGWAYIKPYLPEWLTALLRYLFKECISNGLWEIILLNLKLIWRWYTVIVLLGLAHCCSFTVKIRYNLLKKGDIVELLYRWIIYDFLIAWTY